jgi:hypothetical protein
MEEEEYVHPIRVPYRGGGGEPRYGWLITLVVTLAAQLIVAVFIYGQLTQKVDDMRLEFGHRLDQLEERLNTRGGIVGPQK